MLTKVLRWEIIKPNVCTRTNNKNAATSGKCLARMSNVEFWRLSQVNRNLRHHLLKMSICCIENGAVP